MTIVTHDHAEVKDIDVYEGIPCHADDGYEAQPWCWCAGCQAEAQRRDDAVAQLMRPIPADAACCVPPDAYDSDFDGFLSEPIPACNPEELRAVVEGFYAAKGGVR